MFDEAPAFTVRAPKVDHGGALALFVARLRTEATIVPHQRQCGVFHDRFLCRGSIRLPAFYIERRGMGRLRCCQHGGTE